VPSPTHQAIINAAHAQLHHNHGYIYGRLALRSLLDMSLICRHWSDDIDWGEVEDRFRRIGAFTAARFSPNRGERVVWCGTATEHRALVRPALLQVGPLSDRPHRAVENQRTAAARFFAAQA
jgi:hypothetical protein